MAAGFLRTLAGGSVEVQVAGVDPRPNVDRMAVHVMRMKGVDISAHRPVRLTATASAHADLVVHLATPEELLTPLPHPKKTVEWIIDDPLGWPKDVYEDVRDDIERAVRLLADWIRRTVAEQQPVRPPSDWNDASPDALAPMVP